MPISTSNKKSAKEKETIKNNSNNSSLSEGNASLSNIPEIASYTDQILAHLKQTVIESKSKMLNQSSVDREKQMELETRVSREKQKIFGVTRRIETLKGEIANIKDLLKKDQSDLELTRKENNALHNQIVELELNLSSLKMFHTEASKRNRSLKSQISSQKTSFSIKERKMEHLANNYRKLFKLDIVQTEMNVINIIFYLDVLNETKNQSSNKDPKSQNMIDRDGKNVKSDDFVSNKSPDNKKQDKNTDSQKASEVPNCKTSKSSESPVRNNNSHQRERKAQFTLDFSNNVSGTITILDPPFTTLDQINQILSQENNFYLFLKRIRKMFKENM